MQTINKNVYKQEINHYNENMCPSYGVLIPHSVISIGETMPPHPSPYRSHHVDSNYFEEKLRINSPEQIHCLAIEKGRKIYLSLSSNTNSNGLWHQTIIGQEILKKKYFYEGEDFSGFVSRVSSIFQDGSLGGSIGNAIENADFFLAGRSLYGAGSKGKFRATMSNCYIQPCPEDNIESIYDVAKQTARIFSMGGGCGVNLSKLRPRGAKVNNSAGTSTGSVSFIKLFDATGDIIGAHGRRAALLIGLNCDHPDIEEFMQVKQNNTEIQSANLSILFTNEFMQAVKNNADFTLRFDVQSTGEHIERVINAREFFLNFCASNHDYAEPGSLFIDRIRSYNLLSGYPSDLYHIDISNPCAEYLGSPYNACTLGSINLYNCVKNPFTPEGSIDKEKLANLVDAGVRALDEVLDYGYDMQPLPENKTCVDDWRAIGLGVFGMADMLIALGMRYGDERSLALIDDTMKFIFTQAIRTSSELAKVKGTFGKYEWKYVSKSPLLKLLDEDTVNLIKKHGLRNGSLISIAPTGTIGTMAGLSGGAEPLFQIRYQRTTHTLSLQKQYFMVYAKSVFDLMVYHGIDPETVTEEEIQARFPFVVTSHDIEPVDRVKMQGTMQRYVDNAISSTVNLKQEASIEDVFDLYMQAWETGCKGITVFRSGCKRDAILMAAPKAESSTKEQPEVKATEQKIVFNSIHPIKSAHLGEVEGKKVVKHTACVKNLYNHVYTDMNGNIVEVFTNTSQGCTSNIGTITRLASLCLRSGIAVYEVIAEMRSDHCAACASLKAKGNKVISNSCGTAIAEAIETVYKQNQIFPKDRTAVSETCATISGQLQIASGVEKINPGLLPCPKCGENTFMPEGRCGTCTNCLWNKCGE